jgi:CHASE2 domain-containing sensor protein
MIDEASEAKYGGFPIDRALTAQAIEKLAAAGVRGIVLKFFMTRRAMVRATLP